jgi:hypothetical protein
MTDDNSLATSLFPLWCGSLGLDSADVPFDADYFTLGGTSYQAVEFIDRAQRELGVVIAIEVVFLDGTFAAVLDSVSATQRSDSLP